MAGVPLLYCVSLSQTVIRLCDTFRAPAAPHAPVTCADIPASTKRTRQQNPFPRALFLRPHVSQQCADFNVSHRHHLRGRDPFGWEVHAEKCLAPFFRNICNPDTLPGIRHCVPRGMPQKVEPYG